MDKKSFRKLNPQEAQKLTVTLLAMYCKPWLGESQKANRQMSQEALQKEVAHAAKIITHKFLRPGK